MNKKLLDLMIKDDLLKQVSKEINKDKDMDALVKLMLLNDKSPADRPNLKGMIDAIKTAFKTHDVIGASYLYIARIGGTKSAFFDYHGIHSDILVALLGQASKIAAKVVAHEKNLNKAVKIIKACITVFITSFFAHIEEEEALNG